MMSPRLVVCGDAASVASRGTDNDAGVFVKRSNDDALPPGMLRRCGAPRGCSRPRHRPRNAKSGATYWEGKRVRRAAVVCVRVGAVSGVKVFPASAHASRA